MVKPPKKEGPPVTLQTFELLLLDDRFELLKSLPFNPYLEPCAT
jgi:hypothetical protein